MGDLSPGTLPAVKPADERLDSWKEIAAYLRRDVTTVQRWEKREGMPVHRHLHDRMGSVYAFSSELDAWSQGRRQRLDEIEEAPNADSSLITEGDHPQIRRPGTRTWLVMGGVAVLALLT